MTNTCVRFYKKNKVLLVNKRVVQKTLEPKMKPNTNKQVFCSLIN